MDSTMRSRCLNKAIQNFNLEISKSIAGKLNFDSQNLLRVLDKYFLEPIKKEILKFG